MQTTHNPAFKQKWAQLRALFAKRGIGFGMRGVEPHHDATHWRLAYVKAEDKEVIRLFKSKALES